MTHHCPPKAWNKTSVLFLILLVTFLCLPAARVLGVPPTLTNVCIYQLGAEILLTWEASGADYYKVYSAEADRWWRPVRTNLTVRWFRDNDYLSLPGYYQVAAYKPTGEYAFSQEILVTERKPLVVLAGVEVRPTPDNAMRLDCEVGYPEPSYPGTWGGISFPAPGGAAAMLEIGTSLSNLGQGIWNPEFSQSHSFLLTDLQPDTVYWYRLTCVGTNGAGFSYVNSFTPRAYVEPKLVTLTATPCSYCQVLETEEDTPIRFILTNEFAPVDLNCAYTIIRQPYFGQITGTSSEFLYTPNLEWCGGDGFAWALSCEGTIVASGEIAINPRPVNDPPIARDASFEGREDFPIQLLPEGYDFDWETVICNMVTGPTNGTIWSDPYHFVYMPKTNFTGMDHITFRASDGKAEGNIATIKIRVTPENDPPQAANMQVTATNNQHTLIHLAGSDVDLLVPGEVVSGSRPYLRYELVTRPQHGGAMFEWPNTIDYTPVNYTGPDSFIYRVTDGSFQAFATVYITVVPENHPPTASTLSVATEFNIPVAVILSGTDPDGNAIIYKIGTGPSNGSLSGAAPSLIYTPTPDFSGTDSFTFTVNDGQFDSLPGTVTISVSPENAPPFAPSNLAGVAPSDHQVTLTWTDHSSLEKGFRVERAVDGVTFKQIATVGDNACTFSDLGVQAGKTYTYRVCAYNKQGASTWSNIATVTPVLP